jgi:hypothetical protein
MLIPLQILSKLKVVISKKLKLFLSFTFPSRIRQLFIVVGKQTTVISLQRQINENRIILSAERKTRKQKQQQHFPLFAL